MTPTTDTASDPMMHALLSEDRAAQDVVLDALWPELAVELAKRAVTFVSATVGRSADHRLVVLRRTDGRGIVVETPLRLEEVLEHRADPARIAEELVLGTRRALAVTPRGSV